MTLPIRSVLARAGAVALLTAGGLAAVSTPASAADGADLTVAPMSSVLAEGTTRAKAKPFKFLVYNVGPATATDVRVAVDVSRLDTDRVRFELPESCVKQQKVFTCTLRDLSGGADSIPAGTSAEFAVLLSTKAGEASHGGRLGVEVSSATPDPDAESNTLTTGRIRIVRASYDLSPWTQDVHADVVVDCDDTGEGDLPPVAPGTATELDWFVYNGGSRRAVGLFYALALPPGARFTEVPEGCEKQDEGFESYFCVDADVVLKPGEAFHRPVRITVDSAEFPVLTPGVVTAFGLKDAEVDAPPLRAKPQPGVTTATTAQRSMLRDRDQGDNLSIFDVFVTAVPGATPSPTGTPVEPTPGPSPSTGTGGGGGGGGLPVTGAQAGLIGGVGLGVVAVGGVLFLMARRRRVVLVTPGDEKPQS
jgi:hypothetical protein